MELISTFANVVLAVIAMTALVIAGRQVRVSREMEAITAYERYHHLVMELPSLTAGFDPQERWLGLSEQVPGPG
jgi:hypothetical protein